MDEEIKVLNSHENYLIYPSCCGSADYTLLGIYKKNRSVFVWVGACLNIHRCMAATCSCTNYSTFLTPGGTCCFLMTWGGASI